MRVANVIDSMIVSGTTHQPIPTAQFDKFRFLDRPLAAPASIPALKTEWEAFEAMTNGWASSGLDWFVKREPTHDGREALPASL